MRIPFTEEGSELVAIHTKDVMDAAVVNSVQTVPKIREEPFKNFVRKERFVERSKRITDPLKKANPPKVITQSKKILSKDKDKVEILKGDRVLFSGLHNLSKSRWHPGRVLQEVREPALASIPFPNGNLRGGKKADLVKCLPDYPTRITESPIAYAVILDGTVIVQMLPQKQRIPLTSISMLYLYLM